MTVVFYDEGMYPSGSANGQVAAGRPELVSQGLALVSQPRPGDEVLARTADGVLVVRPSGGTIRGVHWGEDDGESGAPASADILNPEAVRRFIELTHEAYYREFKDCFGSTVLGFFTDEPSILGRNAGDMFPWTRGFAELFAAAGGDAASLAPLFRRQIGFQYLPESVWPECREENGALFCRGRRYGAVLGPGDMFPGVPHDVSAIEPDCRCDPPQPDLRAARFVRSGTQCWLLVNEGEGDVETVLTLPTDKPVGSYDLWTGKAVSAPQALTALSFLKIRIDSPSGL